MTRVERIAWRLGCVAGAVVAVEGMHRYGRPVELAVLRLTRWGVRTWNAISARLVKGQ